MESRKHQLQTQIVEALKANDNDLYCLLKSQWAHRFGVESLEELKNLDLSQANQKPPQEDNQRIDQLQDSFCEVQKEIHIKDDDIQEKEMTNGKKKVVKSVDVENKESFKIKSYEISEKKNNKNISLKPVIDSNISPKVEALIPLPPKPKYSYLNKWLLRS